MRISMFFLLFSIPFIEVSSANSSNKNWEITHKLINEANAVDRQLLDKAAGKGMRDSAKSESRRAWERVKAHLESLSLGELVETAASAAESVAHRTELTEDWEREAAAASNVEFVLSMYHSKNPAPRDINALVQRIKNSQESAYFRVALLSWFSSQIMQERLPSNYSDHVKNSVIQASHDILCDTQNPESVRLAAYNTYSDVIIQDILSTCKKNEILRPYLGNSEKKSQLFKHLDSGEITVSDAIKMHLMDRNKSILWIVNNFSKELANDTSSRIKSMIHHKLRQLSNTPIGVIEHQEVERLQFELRKKEQ